MGGMCSLRDVAASNSESRFFRQAQFPSEAWFELRKGKTKIVQTFLVPA
jgi:hypothetical protein